MVTDMTAIQSIIQRKLQEGVLPRQRPREMFAALGHGAACTVCELPITPHEIEWSFWARGVITHRFHVGCHGVWHAECGRRRLSMS